jgi:glucokinase
MKSNIKYAVGVDLGGTNVKVGIVSDYGKIIKKTSIDTKASEGPNKVVAQIITAIGQVLNNNKLKIKGIGIGAAGVVIVEKGIVENPPNVPGWKKVKLASIIENYFHIKTKVENDANAAAIAEMMFGAGKKFHSFIMVTLGTGVGGGIIFNKKIYRGNFGAAGEIGHVSIDYQGQQCNCGSFGCVETFVGNKYLVKRVQTELSYHKDSMIWNLINNDLSLLTPLIIEQALLKNDYFATKVVADLGKYLGIALASVANAIDISTFIIGGGVSGFGTPLIKSIQDTTSSRVLKSLKDKIKIIPAKLKNDAGIIGASSLIFYKS